jgi:hypothetical protein
MNLVTNVCHTERSSISAAWWGPILAFGRWNSDNPKAPQNLTGCGREMPKGFFEVAIAFTLEVRPAILSRFEI